MDQRFAGASQAATPAELAVVETLSALSAPHDDLAAVGVAVASEIQVGSDFPLSAAFASGGHQLDFMLIDTSASAQRGKPGGGGGGGSAGGSGGPSSPTSAAKETWRPGSTSGLNSRAPAGPATCGKRSKMSKWPIGAPPTNRV